MNKKNITILLIILLIPIFAFADDPTDALKQPFALGGIISGIIDGVCTSFSTIFTTNLTSAMSKLSGLFKALIYIGVMYELAKTYLEGNYNELPIKVCTLSFKYIAIGTFLGVIGGVPYFFKIPSEIIGYATGTPATSYDWSPGSATPMKALSKLTAGIYGPWDNTAATLVKDTFVLAFSKMTLTQFVMGIVWIFIAIIYLIILLLGYVLLSIGVLGIIMKAVEITIAIPIAVLFLAGKAIGVGEQYFNISMKYVIASMMDVAIVLMVCKVGNGLFGSMTFTDGIDLVKGVFVCLIYLVLLKIAPKIGSGLLSGRPGVTMKDSTNLLTMGSVGASIAMGAGSIAGGAASGAMAARANGGNMFSGAMKGAGEKAGGADGALSKMRNNMGKALS